VALPTPSPASTAVVTGASSGIGAAIARELADRGHGVTLVARREDRLRELADELAGRVRVEVIACDVADSAARAGLFDEVDRRGLPADILVNNAGIGVTGKPLHETTLDEWKRQMQTNLRGPFLTIKAFAPMMIAAQSGHIVNISSLAGKNPLPNGAAYAASKWGLNGLTYSVAEELRPYNIRVSVVAPGSVNTRFGSGGNGKNAARKLQPDDVAHVVAMLVTQTPQSFVSEVLIRPTQKP